MRLRCRPGRATARLRPPPRRTRFSLASFLPIFNCGDYNTKKKTTRYLEQDPEKVAAYQEKIKDIPSEKVAYVDECGIDTYLYREYGYAPRGQQIFGRISGRKYKRCGIVAAKMGDKLLAPFQYSGTMNSTLFEFWFTKQLLPSLEMGTVIVMDNASFHS